jgi:hypothetical protein
MASNTRLQLEVIAWVSNDWQSQWISGYMTSDVGVLEVQVRGSRWVAA